MEEWVIALITLAVVAICIILSIILVQMVQKFNWKPDYRRKLEDSRASFSLPQPRYSQANVQITEDQQAHLQQISIQTIHETPQNGSVEESTQTTSPIGFVRPQNQDSVNPSNDGKSL